jgi:hypothetical protein
VASYNTSTATAFRAAPCMHASVGAFTALAAKQRNVAVDGDVDTTQGSLAWRRPA